MLRWIWMQAFVSVLSAMAWASPAEEQLRIQYGELLRTPGLKLALVQDRKVLTDVLWDEITVGKNIEMQKRVSELDLNAFDLADRIKLLILAEYPKKPILSKDLVELVRQSSNQRAKLTLRHYRDYFENGSHFSGKPAFDFRVKTREELRDLFFFSPPSRNGIRLFSFCRKDRQQKCRLLMRDRDGRVVRNEDGSIWSQPALGQSKLGLPFSQSNGDTPSGVYTLDSVMPHADRSEVFGKFRRIIMNFIPASRSERSLRRLLPSSARDKKWWKQSVIARDIGRSLFRIHGSGTIETTEEDPSHPLRPTFGCVMQREGVVGDIEYLDQSRLLNTAMRAQGLAANYENQTKIRGLFYFIEIDDHPSPVGREELFEIFGL